MPKTQLLNKTQSPSETMWMLILAYAMVITIANWFDARLIHLAGLNTDAGTLIFPFSFLLSDLITEVYGYKRARQAIRIGLVFNLTFLAYSQLVIFLPGPEYAPVNDLYNQLMGTNMRIIAASYISYLVSEPLNSMTLAELKVLTHGRWMGFRFVLSTAIATFVDNCLFNTVLFAGTLTWSHILDIAYGTWVIKVAIEVLGLPLSILLAKKLKKKEKLDIYDTRTRYSLLRLDHAYEEQDNAYVSTSGDSQ